MPRLGVVYGNSHALPHLAHPSLVGHLPQIKPKNRAPPTPSLSLPVLRLTAVDVPRKKQIGERITPFADNLISLIFPNLPLCKTVLREVWGRLCRRRFFRGLLPAGRNPLLHRRFSHTPVSLIILAYPNTMARSSHPMLLVEHMPLHL